jgi:hypothetical protein
LPTAEGLVLEFFLPLNRERGVQVVGLVPSGGLHIACGQGDLDSNYIVSEHAYGTWPLADCEGLNLQFLTIGREYVVALLGGAGPLTVVGVGNQLLAIPTQHRRCVSAGFRQCVTNANQISRRKMPGLDRSHDLIDSHMSIILQPSDREG